MNFDTPWDVIEYHDPDENTASSSEATSVSFEYTTNERNGKKSKSREVYNAK